MATHSDQWVTERAGNDQQYVASSMHSIIDSFNGLLMANNSATSLVVNFNEKL